MHFVSSSSIFISYPFHIWWWFIRIWWTEQSLPPAQSFYLSTTNMNADSQINTYETKKGRCTYLYAQKNSSTYLYERYTKQEHLSKKFEKQQSENRFKETVLNSCRMQGMLHKLQIGFLNKIWGCVAPWLSLLVKKKKSEENLEIGHTLSPKG